MDRIQKARELLERAPKLGLRVEVENGVNILKKTADVSEDPELMMEFTKFLPEIRSILQARAVAAVAKKYVGSSVFSKKHGAGRLVAAHDDGTVSVRVGTELRRSSEEESHVSRITVGSNTEDLLIVVVDEEEADETSSSADQKPELRKKFLGLI
jgi:hypothetical protein